MPIWRFALFLFICSRAYAGPQQGADGMAGGIPGVMSWTVPPTSNGLNPSQSWLSIAASPDGDIYLTGCDHRTNSALYRLRRSDGRLVCVGDARTASEAANNWLPGETAEKFHVRPVFHRGRLYLATADFTNANDGYLRRRGFHWYAFDIPSDRFMDLSASEPGGVAGAHASIVATALDEERGLIYAHDTPRGELYCYDIAAGRTVDLGKPQFVPDGLHMPGRYMWMGRDGRVYFTISACNCVAYYDPKTGFGEKEEWLIAGQPPHSKVFRTGTMSLDHERIYAADEDGRIYRYNRRNDTFHLLGQATSADVKYACKGTLKMRAFNVTADEKKVYFVNDDAAASAFWEWDVEGNTTKRLCDMSVLDGRIGAPGFDGHGGNDSWDEDGNLYFCSFGRDQTRPTGLVLTRLDPVRLKVRLARSEGVGICGLWLAGDNMGTEPKGKGLDH
jgi:hypothetical protein